jgi:homogentisate phytyltransferase / homogentisate geranylgeranyltransferase
VGRRVSRVGAAASARAPRAAHAHPLVVLWRFSRPHTVFGTALSVIGLWAIAAAERDGATPAWDLLATLVAGLAVNIAIVGINQITDVEIDRVNKPHLPIAAGELSLRSAAVIVAVCTVLPLGMAVTQGAWETAAVAAGLAVGAVYSLPPFRLKRYPVAASLCISGVRSIVVNLGVYWHFAGQIDPPVVALCLFVLPFSLAIAILKDVPDIEGDRRYAIRTFTVRLGPERVFRAGLAALLVAYAGMAFVAPFALRDSVNPVVLAVGHVLAAALLLHWARSAEPRRQTAFTRFYMRVWALFFLEYLIVPLACLANV